MMRRPLAIGLGLLLAGCATLVKPHDPILAELQDFTDRTQREYRLFPNIPVMWMNYQPIGPAASIGAVYVNGSIYVNPVMRSAPDRLLLLAHELGHRILRHAKQGNPAYEFAANAKAIEVLTRTGGMSEFAALSAFHTYLVHAHRRGLTAFGHATPCEEILDLLARFPQHRALWQTWECAPTATP